MVPVTEVAFMPGTVAGDSVMVGLGEDYYVERTPRKAQEILRRRMEGVCSADSANCMQPSGLKLMQQHEEPHLYLLGRRSSGTFPLDPLSSHTP